VNTSRCSRSFIFFVSVTSQSDRCALRSSTHTNQRWLAPCALSRHSNSGLTEHITRSTVRVMGEILLSVRWGRAVRHLMMVWPLRGGSGCCNLLQCKGACEAGTPTACSRHSTSASHAQSEDCQWVTTSTTCAGGQREPDTSYTCVASEVSRRSGVQVTTSGH
jgi:hypothetical protein